MNSRNHCVWEGKLKDTSFSTLLMKFHHSESSLCSFAIIKHISLDSLFYCKKILYVISKIVIQLTKLIEASPSIEVVEVRSSTRICMTKLNPPHEREKFFCQFWKGVWYQSLNSSFVHAHDTMFRSKNWSVTYFHTHRVSK